MWSGRRSRRTGAPTRSWCREGIVIRRTVAHAVAIAAGTRLGYRWRCAASGASLVNRPTGLSGARCDGLFGAGGVCVQSEIAHLTARAPASRRHREGGACPRPIPVRLFEIALRRSRTFDVDEQGFGAYGVAEPWLSLRAAAACGGTGGFVAEGLCRPFRER